MTPRVIVPIVEGDSEVAAVPQLLRRMLHEKHERFELEVQRPIKVKQNQIISKTGTVIPEGLRLPLTRARSAPNAVAVILLLDADKHCPASVAPTLMDEVTKQAPNLKSSVVLAKCEYEAWFLGSLESLRGVRGISKNAENHPNPESVAAAKAHLDKLMPRNMPYRETADQIALTAAFDMEMARRNCPSFDKFAREVERLLNDI